jgi:hypothetical protein
MPDQHVFTSGHFALDVMGANAGFVKKFDGLNMEADVVTNDLGPENVQKKHVTNIRWTPARVTIAPGMGKQLAKIIQRVSEAERRPFDGALHLLDANFKIHSSVTFTGALITSVTVPKLDGSSKDAAYFDLEWEADQVRWVKGDSSDLRRPSASQKVWLSSNFRLEMGGLPCNRVATIESFTWRCARVPEPIGGETKHPAKVTVPNIKVSISMADFDAWFQAATKWFVDGDHDETHEMSGAIVMLAPDMKTEIGRVTLKNCGFAKFLRAPLEAASDTVARFSCEFYVEAMEFAIK